MKLISILLLLYLTLLTPRAIFSQAEAELLNFNQDHGDHLVCGLSKDVVLQHSTPPLKILSDYPSTAEFDCGKFKVFYADLLPGAPAGGFGDPALGATSLLIVKLQSEQKIILKLVFNMQMFGLLKQIGIRHLQNGAFN